MKAKVRPSRTQRKPPRPAARWAVGSERHPTRVVIADAHEIVRASLRCLLEKEMPWLTVIDEAADGQEAVEKSCALSPNVLLMDLSLPKLNGIDVTRQVVARSSCGVLIFSARSELGLAREAMRAGASGFVLKSGPLHELSMALRAVAEQKVFLSPSIALEVVNAQLRPAKAPSGAGDPDAHGPSAYRVLTARQRQVLQLLAEGGTNKDLARRLHIGARTVETHRWQIMNKLKMRSIAELTKYAIRQGLTTV